jgi:hypothetical protein
MQLKARFFSKKAATTGSISIGSRSMGCGNYYLKPRHWSGENMEFLDNFDGSTIDNSGKTA